jgi:hypothetical protein
MFSNLSFNVIPYDITRKIDLFLHSRKIFKIALGVVEDLLKNATPSKY